MKNSILALCLLSGCGLTQAATLTGSIDAVTGINGLVVGGTTYDVTFNTNVSYDSVYGTNMPTFMNNEAGAVSALSAIVDVFNFAKVSNVFDAPKWVQNRGSYVQVPYLVEPNSDITYRYAYHDNVITDWSVYKYEWTDYADRGTPGNSWVSFTEVSAVPVPAAAFMFAPALIGFIGLRRRNRTS